ncbi:Protein Farnesyltransferase Subunit Beta [Manis pentadactyla]|nr:Protein Farnesyltransferase Subunit Beta [Manis pentadactyla]
MEKGIKASVQKTQEGPNSSTHLNSYLCGCCGGMRGKMRRGPGVIREFWEYCLGGMLTIGCPIYEADPVPVWTNQEKKSVRIFDATNAVTSKNNIKQQLNEASDMSS